MAGRNRRRWSVLAAAIVMVPQSFVNVAAGSEDLVGNNFRVSDRQATGAEYDAAIAHNTRDGQSLVVGQPYSLAQSFQGRRRPLVYRSGQKKTNLIA